MAAPRIAITGIGTLNACGEGRDAFFAKALGRQSGIRPTPEGVARSLGVHRTGSLPAEFMANRYIANRKSLKVMCRDIQIAVCASMLARQDSGLTESTMTPARSGICVGAGVFDNELEELADSFHKAEGSKGEFDSRKFALEGMPQLFPLWLLKYLPNMPACHISIAHNLQGPSNTHMADHSASAASLEEACDAIIRGDADVMFAGGSESRLNPQGLIHFLSTQLMNAQPDTSQPYPVFSDASNGYVLGEGGAILILERWEHALKRGAAIYAEIAGITSLSTPDYEVTLGQALDQAGIKTSDVDGVHLFASGKKDVEAEEAGALEKVFGRTSQKPWLTATKPLTGFLGFASTATEVALAAMSLKQKTAVPSWVAADSGRARSFDYADRSKPQKAPRCLLVNHLNPGYSNYAILLKSAEGVS